MSVKVPVRCEVTIRLTCKIDITEKSALTNKMTEIVTNLKAQFPEKIVCNAVYIKTDFAEEEWKV